MKRVHVLGASGSGTTTLAAALAVRLDCAHFDADEDYWLPTRPPFRTKRAPAERDALLRARFESAPRWVHSGSIVSWSPDLFEHFDAIVYLSTPTPVRLARLRAREERMYLDDPCWPRAEFEADLAEFLAWAARFDDGGPEVRSAARLGAWIAERDRPTLRIEGDLTTDERLARTLAFLR